MPCRTRATRARQPATTPSTHTHLDTDTVELGETLLEYYWSIKHVCLDVQYTRPRAHDGASGPDPSASALGESHKSQDQP
jgi:hypothetical protein